MNSVLAEIEKHPKIGVPLHLRNAPTKLMKEIGYGAEYQYPHDTVAGYVAGLTYLPDELKGRVFYEPSERGYEKTIRERMEYLKNK